MKQDKQKLYDIISASVTKRIKNLEFKISEFESDPKKAHLIGELKKEVEDLMKQLESLNLWNDESWKKEIEEMNKKTVGGRIKAIGFTLFCSKHLYYNDDGKIDNFLLASIIEYYFPMVHFGEFYLFDKGIYKKVTDLYVNKIITRILFVTMNNGTKNETMDRLKTFSSVTKDDFRKMFLMQNYRLINFENCYIEFGLDKNERLTSKFTVKQHNPNVFFNIQIPISFDKNIMNEDLTGKTPAFNQYLNSTFNDDVERTIFKEFSGSCFFHTNYVEKMVFARGDGGNGKGTWDRILKQMFGNHYCNPKCTQLTDGEKQNQFYGLEFIDSYVGFSTEVNKNIKDLTMVKMFAGLDELNIELKHSNDRLKFIPPTKLIFSLNNTAKIYETEEAIKRRVIFFKMNNKIKKDSTLEPRMKKEIKYIFYTFFKSLLNLIDRDCQFILPDSHYELAKICWESNNDFTNFISNNIEYDENCKGIARKTIFEMMNNEFGNKFKKSKSNFYNLFEAELKNQDIKIIIKKDRMDNYFISNDEIMTDDNNKYTSMTAGYKHLRYVESKICSEQENNENEQIGKKLSDELYSSDVNFIKEFSNRNLTQLINLEDLLKRTIESKRKRLEQDLKQLSLKEVKEAKEVTVLDRVRSIKLLLDVSGFKADIERIDKMNYEDQRRMVECLGDEFEIEHLKSYLNSKKDTFSTNVSTLETRPF